MTVSSNEIRTLPESFQTLALDHIDVFGNPFERFQQEIALNPESLILKVATLRAISAKSTIKFKLVLFSIYVFFLFFFYFVYFSCQILFSYRLKYTEEDIPATLITYLHESSTICPCGKLCIDDGLPADGEINLLKVSGSVTGDKIVPMKMTLCTTACFQRFALKVVS